MTGEPRRTAADKTLDVLEALAEHHGVADLAKATGLPKPTVHRILQTLVQRGFARQVDHGSYVGGARILTLVRRHQPAIDLPNQLRPALDELQKETKWTVHFALLAGDEAVYAAKVEGDRPYHLASRVGMSLALHSTSVGKSMLACLPEEAVRALLARTGMPPRTARTHISPDELIAELGAVRTRGYAEDHEENEEGVIAVGAPVFDHTGQVIGGISAATLSHPADAAAVPDCGRAVADAARRTSLMLGAAPRHSDLSRLAG
ncbi:MULTISPECIES: IclR family transcriptional regulator [Streptomyces]|uniref:IclR family transcriptional regulator n=1 Tax=Streptomyces lycii TaxID=2654337 RepID=A0ABQ7FM55_9ACTN|nr:MULTISPECIES: IclR family transcriptional regulator [Streptomyces]KAF4409048.1 IclR family transcriptional regulator [Streptomyces lycii]